MIPAWLKAYRKRVLSPDEYLLLDFIERMAAQLELSAATLKATMPKREKRRRGMIDTLASDMLALYHEGPGISGANSSLPSERQVKALAEEAVFVQSRSEMEAAAPMFGREVAAVWAFWLLHAKDLTLRLTRARAGIILDRIADSPKRSGLELMLAIQVYAEACALAGATVPGTALEDDILGSTEQFMEWLKRALIMTLEARAL